MSDQPIACTLPRADLRGRLGVFDTLAADALLDQTPIPDGVRSRFRDTADVERRVQELVALESQCCAFLRFDVRRDDGAIVLEITGAPDAQSVIEQFFAR
jgi:hypothetical protein